MEAAVFFAFASLSGLSALIMGASSISETSVNFYHTTRRNNPEENHLRDFAAFVCFIIKLPTFRISG
jgi:hypothetical protein